jgi:hypothetical protein
VNEQPTGWLPPIGTDGVLGEAVGHAPSARRGTSARACGASARLRKAHEEAGYSPPRAEGAREVWNHGPAGSGKGAQAAEFTGRRGGGHRSGDAEVLDLLALKGGALPSGVIRREGRHIANRELDELDDMTHQSAMEYPNAARMAISLVHPDRYWSMKRSP